MLPVTLVVPLGKVAPDCGALATVTEPESSDAVNAKVTARPHVAGAVVVAMFAGAVI